jgi:peptide/nickel transport system permease protein
MKIAGVEQMTGYVARRLLFTVVILLLVSAAVYAIFAFLPFDPAALTCGKNCRPSLIAQNRIRLGYDKPIYLQYWYFLKGIFAGRAYGMGSAAFVCAAPSFGYSFRQNQCVTSLLTEALPVTLSLAIGAMILWLFVGVGLGVIAARFKGRWPDSGSSAFVLIGTSLPTFVTGLMLLVFVKIRWGLIPFSLVGYVSIFDDPVGFLKLFILPWIGLAFAFAAIYTRFTRATVLETLGEDYIRTARAKGLSEKMVLRRHTLRAAIAPIVTLAGLDFAGLLGGAIITETIFNLPGLGRLSLQSVTDFDLPIVVATVLLAAGIVVIMNLIVDLLYAVIDPRVRVA